MSGSASFCAYIRSISVRWRISPIIDIGDGGHDFSASWAGESPAHLCRTLAR